MKKEKGKRQNEGPREEEDETGRKAEILMPRLQ
jgi:hypothetical protein